MPFFQNIRIHIRGSPPASLARRKVGAKFGVFSPESATMVCGTRVLIREQEFARFRNEAEFDTYCFHVPIETPVLFVFFIVLFIQPMIGENKYISNIINIHFFWVTWAISTPEVMYKSIFRKRNDFFECSMLQSIFYSLFFPVDLLIIFFFFKQKCQLISCKSCNSLFYYLFLFKSQLCELQIIIVFRILYKVYERDGFIQFLEWF